MPHGKYYVQSTFMIYYTDSFFDALFIYINWKFRLKNFRNVRVGISNKIF